MTESWMPEKHDFEDFFSLPLKAAALNGDDDPMSKALALFVLLYGVPFAYLVPFEACLGENETRFFYLDPNWIKALLDGAMSLGRNAGVDYAHDRAYLSEVYNRTITGAGQIRPNLQGIFRGEHVSALEGSDCTGFLMRSPLVRGWRGLEFKAYGEDGGELRALRIESLGNEVLLGLYRGRIKRMDVLEPPEGLHYGFNRDADTGILTKKLRRLENGELYDEIIPIAEKPRRVIDISAAAAAIGSALKLTPTSAHIALEMIQNPYMLNFKEE